MPPALLTGSFACTKIQYTSSTPPTVLSNCHCGTCRKQSGAPYQTWAILPASSITFTRAGEKDPVARRSSTFATRRACARCGASVSMQYDFNPDGLGIAAGTIDSESLAAGEEGIVPRPKRHIYLKEKAEWFEVPEDETERWEGHFDGVREIIDGILGEQGGGTRS